MEATVILALALAQTVVLGPYRVELTTSHDPAIRVLHEGRAIWSGVPKRHQPWKLAGGDVDGNGLPDFAVGVFKRTHLYPEAHNTVFFYEIRGGAVVPKWKGSSLGRPLVDFAYAKVRGKPKLVALQRRLDHSLGLFVWTWNKFGFRLDRELGVWKEASLGATRENSIEIRAQSGTEWVKL